MPLTSGSRLGPYEILSPLGAGGMGEVYRARDTKLHRDVAIKVLPDHRTIGPMNLGVLPLVGERKPHLFEPSRVTQATGQVSPDGRWLAYHSLESGRYEVYVQSFPAPGAGKWQISKDGGANAGWRGDGRELLYYAFDGRLMAVPVTGSTALDVGAAVPLFDAHLLNGPNPVTGFKQQYDVARDGQRFLLNVPLEQATSPPITLLVNWTAGLKK